MRKAFTMIELLFVIVIIGVLAAIAIPRLASTRNDAEMAKLAINLSTLISDLQSYHVSQGEFAANIKEMTSVQFGKVEKNGDSELIGRLAVGGENCITITALKPGHPQADEVGSGYIRVEMTDATKNKAICKEVANQPFVRNLLNSTFEYEKADEMIGTMNGIAIGERIIF